VLDTNVLLNDCVRVARTQAPSILLRAADAPIVHLYAAEHVRGEVERLLPTYSKSRGVRPEDAIAAWNERHLRALRFVDVGVHGCDQRVVDVAERDPSDFQTAALAQLLAPCLVFSRDKDLIDAGIAQGDWVRLTSSAGDVAQLQAVWSGGTFALLLAGVFAYESGRAILGVARHAPVLIGAGLGAAAYLLGSHWRSELGSDRRAEARRLFGEAMHGLTTIAMRAAEAETLLESAAFVAEREQDGRARIARAVGVAAVPPSVAEVAAQLGLSTQRTAAYMRSPVFMSTGEGRYLLGRSYALGAED
jgi:hypothetical protein